MSGQVVAIIVAALACGALGAAGPRVVSRLREPEADPDGPVRPTYAELAARRNLVLRLAVTGLAVGALVGWELGWTPVLAAWVFLAGAGVVLGYVDAQTRLLPTQIIAPSYAVIGLLLLAAALAQQSLHHLVGALIGWAVMGGFYFLMWFIYPRGLGYGDVRLAGLIGPCLGYLGWGALVTGIYAGFLLGGLGGLLLAGLRIVDRRRYPFGPFMLLGALAGLVWGASFAQWYGGW